MHHRLTAITGNLQGKLPRFYQIRASKAKGLWTGGVPKLGYDIKDKKLVINPVEAEQVRSIFEGYLQCGSLAELEKFAEIKGFKQKTG